jgi:UPF0755 protein
MKKIIRIVFLLLIITACYAGWKFFGPATAFDGKNYYLHIKTGNNYGDVLNTLKLDHVVDGTAFFEIIANRFDYPQKVKAGRYNIKKDMSLVNILRMLKNGQQDPVNLVITKIRTKEDFASIIGRRFECDSASFIIT